MIDPKATRRKRNLSLRLCGWDSPEAVARIHVVFEWLETVSLAAAIGLEVLGVRTPANICWVILAASDIARHVYSLRDKHLAGEENAALRENLARLNALSEQEMRASVALESEVDRLRKDSSEMTLLHSYRSLGEMLAFETAMKDFNGTRYAIEFLGVDRECGNFQWILNGALRKAGWVRTPLPTIHRTNMHLGVLIMTVAWDTRSLPSTKPADALAVWLDANNVATQTAIVKRDDPQGTVIVLIGPRPETMEQYSQIRAAFRQQKNQRQ
jgi:hypothetical protein